MPDTPISCASSSTAPPAADCRPTADPGVRSTSAATTAGLQAAQAAAQVGTWAVMVAGSVGMVVGIFHGLAIAKSKD